MENVRRKGLRGDCIAVGTILGVLGIITSIAGALCSFKFILILSYAGAAEIAVGLIVISGELSLDSFIAKAFENIIRNLT